MYIDNDGIAWEARMVVNQTIFLHRRQGRMYIMVACRLCDLERWGLRKEGGCIRREEGR